ncbi:hypothetical protein EYF80_021156 [Liparis tanakae]|uniref:Uncharacterized protein n=1 Tax=Liparis tanakae TaxID=230148 RepID=A0A4Z2HUP2_9TELE|nr:hypothetical protein EYF80_021156 [Liparis tanakae]
MNLRNTKNGDLTTSEANVEPPSGDTLVRWTGEQQDDVTHHEGVKRLHRLSGVVDSVVNTLGAPEGIGVVKLEQVDSAAGVLMAAGVHLLMTVPPTSHPHLTFLILVLVAGLGHVHADRSRGSVRPFEEDAEADVIIVRGKLPEKLDLVELLHVLLVVLLLELTDEAQLLLGAVGVLLGSVLLELHCGYPRRPTLSCTQSENRDSDVCVDYLRSLPRTSKKPTSGEASGL